MQAKEKFKTYATVFDESTLRTLFKLSGQGYFDDLKSPISVGKESNIFSAVKDGEERIAVKIYRVNNCDFHKMHQYLQGDSRFRGLTTNRRTIISVWAKREFQNLLIARAAGIHAPTPYAVSQNVLVMSFIGLQGKAAPKLKDAEPQALKEFSQTLFNDMKTLHDHNLVHGDLSEYNILNDQETPILIDFSHSVRLTYPGARDFLLRDIANVVRYFKSKGLPITIEEVTSFITHGIPIRA